MEKGAGECSPALYRYSEKGVRIAVRILGSLLSSLMPMISIIVLFFVNRLIVRLGLVCIFTLLFSLCMSLGTNARRMEVFASTAAFASVQVVFVGTTSEASA